jgi:hypothetical protein
VGNQKISLFENLALVKLAALGVGGGPREVLVHHVLSFRLIRIKLLPRVGFIIGLPVGTQLQIKHTISVTKSDLTEIEFKIYEKFRILLVKPFTV